ncbi:MAG: recombinase family protein [Alphaproteobacteria bacterium]|nr:recombinase family protein [Alphaproteobacteria bacterium]
MTVFAYYRVSTDKQDFESQKIGVVDYAKRAGLTIDKEIIDDGVSGTVKACKRNLGKLLVEMKYGDTVITSELSRLGRSTMDVLDTCQKFADRGVNCYLVKQGMMLDRSPMGKLMTAIFSAFAEMERDLISMRTKEGLARKKAQGVKLGRRPGSKNTKRWYDGRETEIMTALQMNTSVKRAAKELGTTSATLHRWMAENNVVTNKNRAAAELGISTRSLNRWLVSNNLKM